jgi:hypothetical protein
MCTAVCVLAHLQSGICAVRMLLAGDLGAGWSCERGTSEGATAKHMLQKSISNKRLQALKSTRPVDRYQLYWSPRPEFIRVAAHFGATVVPFGAIGCEENARAIMNADSLAAVASTLSRVRGLGQGMPLAAGGEAKSSSQQARRGVSAQGMAEDEMRPVCLRHLDSVFALALDRRTHSHIHTLSPFCTRQAACAALSSVQHTQPLLAAALVIAFVFCVMSALSGCFLVLFCRLARPPPPCLRYNTRNVRLTPCRSSTCQTASTGTTSCMAGPFACPLTWCATRPALLRCMRRRGAPWKTA